MTRGTPSAYVISITPFTESGELDDEAARAHLRRLAEAGVGVYVGGGGSGEGHTLTRDEVARLLALAVEELAGVVPVRAMGVEPRTAGQMIDLVELAKDAGVEGAQIYSLDMGHLAKPTVPEMERYFSAALDACEIPAILSTHFSVGYMVPVELLNRLCDRFDQIVGINCSTPDTGYLTELLADLDPRVEVHIGGPMHALTNWAMGGTGFLSSEGNLVPGLVQSLVDHYAAGEYAAAQSDYTTISRVFALLSGADTKAILRSLGLPGGYPRLPRMTRSDESDVRAIGQRLLELRIPELDSRLPVGG
jgi:4-hydroxy-tetrahydrodipicolinate synthase